MNRRKWQIRGMLKILIISSRNWNNVNGDKKRKNNEIVDKIVEIFT